MGCFTSKEDSLKYNLNFNKDLLLSLPDEVIEEILSSLPCSDLCNWRNAGGRLQDCTNRALKKKPSRKFIM